MVTEDQSRVIAFLDDPATHGGAAVERIETHSAIVFLAGDRALKIKRAVHYDYLDFSTAERRRAMCVAEVRVNRRTAPGLYRGVVAITETPDGRLHLGGDGTPVEWAVEMRRFAKEWLLDGQATSGRLPLQLMAPLGATIARFHAHAHPRPECGGWEAMSRVIDGNAAGFAREGAGVLHPVQCAQLTQRSRFLLNLWSALLDARRETGQVRECHGDLHLRNIVLLDGQPTLFDAIEFNDDIACIDVLYDFAFLVMDLWRLGLPQHANAVWNGYLAQTLDFEGLQLMPLFLSCRAAVAAKTTAASASLQTDYGRRAEQSRLAADHLRLAAGFLHEPEPRLIAIGGLSGSGKSTLAVAMAPFSGVVPGAVVIRSNVIRKELARAKALERLGPEAYTETMTRKVYAAMLERADVVVRSGYSAIVDAVFARQPDRAAVQHIAAAAGVPFTGLWLEAPAPVLTARVRGRTANASDADAEVVRRQLARQLGDVPWHRVDASQLAPQVLLDAMHLMKPRHSDGVRCVQSPT